LDISTKPLIEWVSDLTARMKPVELTAGEAEINQMAMEAKEQWTGNFNPVPLQPSDFVDLYRAAFALPEPA
jgi:alcohol dehydrogenase class IV